MSSLIPTTARGVGTYAALDDSPDGIVTYPGSARDTLGLQWRIGASHEELESAARAFIAPGTTAVLGVHDGAELWTSLILDFDDDWKVSSITTADPSVVDIHGERDDLLGRLIRWVEEAGKSVSLARLLDREGADELCAARGADKGAVLRRLLAEGRTSVGPAPEAFATG